MERAPSRLLHPKRKRLPPWGNRLGALQQQGKRENGGSQTGVQIFAHALLLSSSSASPRAPPPPPLRSRARSLQTGPSLPCFSLSFSTCCLCCGITLASTALCYVAAQFCILPHREDCANVGVSYCTKQINFFGTRCFPKLFLNLILSQLFVAGFYTECVTIFLTSRKIKNAPKRLIF